MIKIEEYQFEDNVNFYWSISAGQYVLEAVKNMEAEIAKLGRKLSSRDLGHLPVVINQSLLFPMH